MRQSKPALPFILITLLLDVLGFSLLIPVAPRLVQQLQHGSIADASGAVTLLAVTYSILQFVFAPMLGVLSDMIGRRPVILIALFGSGIDFFAQALSPTLSWLFVTRAINGLTGASITPCSAYIADITTPKDRAAAFGMMGAAFGLGFVVGPLMGGYLGDLNIRYPFYAAGIITLANWLYGWFVLAESLPPDRRRAFTWKRVNPFAAIPTLSHYPLILGLAGALFLLNTAEFGLHVTWVLSMGYRFDWTSHQVGLSLAVVGTGAIIVQGGLARRIIPKLGERRSLLIGIFIAILAYTGYGLATHGWMIYAIVAVASLGGIAQPAAQSLITRTARPDEQGAVQGAITSLRSAAQILGPAIGGSVFTYFISDKVHTKIPGAPFLVGAGLGSLGWVAAAWATTLAPTRAAAGAAAPTAHPQTPPPAPHANGDASPSHTAPALNQTAPHTKPSPLGGEGGRRL